MRKIASSLALLVVLAGCEPNEPEGATEGVGPPVDGVFPMEGEVEVRTVRVGLSGPELDACAGFGIVRTEVDGGQPVLAAPSPDAAETDRLANDQDLTICEMAGGWIGVVYSQEEDGDLDCETSSPVASEQDYDGPCRSGWIRDGAVEFVAG